MKLDMKWLSIVVVLTLLLMAPALATTPKPVLVVTDYKVAPAAAVSATSVGPLMPGDTGTVLVTIANTFKGTTAGTTSTQSKTDNFYNAGSAHAGPDISQTTSSSSTDVPQGCSVLKLVSLQDSGPVKVTSQPYVNPGCLGTGDSGRFEFTITADGSAADGKYYLPFTVKTDDDAVYLNYYIPVVVEDGGVHMIVNDAPKSLSTGKSSVVLDIVNYLSGGVNSVSVIPAGDEFSFKPLQEYTVGSIGAGEMYTVTFDVSSKNASYSGSPSFVVKYKNGDNWHQSAPMSLSLDAKASSAATAPDTSGLVYLLGGIVLLAVIVGGLFLYMRGQRAKK